jgi:lipopolysaccharide biosynthesis glycosyltransferase
MKDFYNQQGNINIIKYYKENILKQEYKLENIEQKNHIHISTSFNDNNINTYITHIASILHQADKEKSFIHIHMMDAGDFNYDTFIKLSKMICNLNNNTEIIVYNANEGVKAFNIRPDRADKFKEEYAKLYAFKILKDIKKIIFINGDNIMVQKDLNELYQLKMDDIYARGISEQPV